MKAVFFNEQGVPGIGSHQTCPCTPQSFTLDVLLPDDSHDVRTLNVQVNGSCVTPTSPPPPSPTPDTQAPSSPRPDEPTGGTVLSCRGTVTLSWDRASDPSGIKSYYVRMEPTTLVAPPQMQEWGPVNGTSTSVPVSCGLGYRWSVQAEDGAGNRSSWSPWAEFGIGVD